MQFGRIYGIGLIVLGIILCLLQFVRYAAQPKTDVNPAHTEKESAHIVSSFPGIVGAGSLVAGIALLVTARRKDEPDPRYKVK
jgi:nitrate reductase gamma subunit